MSASSAGVDLLLCGLRCVRSSMSGALAAPAGKGAPPVLAAERRHERRRRRAEGGAAGAALPAARRRSSRAERAGLGGVVGRR